MLHYAVFIFPVSTVWIQDKVEGFFLLPIQSSINVICAYFLVLFTFSFKTKHIIFQAAVLVSLGITTTVVLICSVSLLL
jgi:hypothetical protein